MGEKRDVRIQLENDLRENVVAPVKGLLGEVEAATLAKRLDKWAAQAARDIVEGNPKTALAAIRGTIRHVYTPTGGTFRPPASWWRTPLGEVVLRRCGHPTEAHVSYATAGAMLGISKQGVADLVSRGKLAAHPEGGVDVLAVRDRKVQLSATVTKKTPHP